MRAHRRPVRITVFSGYFLVCREPHTRKGFDGLAALVQTQLSEDPFSGQLFVFRGRAGNHVSLCILVVEARKFERFILSISRKIVRPTRRDFPQAYLYRI